jgi:hypothetical protein
MGGIAISVFAREAIRTMSRKNRQFPFVTFVACHEHLDENGIWNPRHADPPLEAAFQVNVFGRREQYIALSDALRAFAEQDLSKIGIDHDHFEGVTSVDGKVRLHLILRIGDDVTGTGFEDYFPASDEET